MSPSLPLQHILHELVGALAQEYGSRLKGVRLYGSHARGDASAGSDIDVAIILDDFAAAGDEISRCAPLAARLSLQYHCVLSLLPIREHDWHTRQTPLLLNVRREAIPVS